ncbi:hypothetical protein [Desulfohalovibrio reitneri]|uniref:hypothetical protein n=1 Tax=Desulfohalovibrio reitneri TaxID=1307759 RepID=UPI0004A77702|nr:hypothetical protein [Desulfohalovibrio reitneri]
MSAAALTAIGTGMGALSTGAGLIESFTGAETQTTAAERQAEYQRRMNEYNAQVAENKAIRAEREADRRAGEIERRAERDKGAARTRLATSGVSLLAPDDSPMDLMTQAAAQAADKADLERRKGDREAWELRSRAGLHRAKPVDEPSSSGPGASSLFKRAGSMFSDLGDIYTTWNL